MEALEGVFLESLRRRRRESVIRPLLRRIRTLEDQVFRAQVLLHWEAEQTQPRRFIPNLIKGDFDSIRDDVKEYYVSKVRFNHFKCIPKQTVGV